MAWSQAVIQNQDEDDDDDDDDEEDLEEVVP